MHAWPRLEETLYRVVRIPIEFLEQFDRNYVGDLGGEDQETWDWFQTFLMTCTPDQLRNGMRFLSGSIFILLKKSKSDFCTAEDQGLDFRSVAPATASWNSIHFQTRRAFTERLSSASQASKHFEDDSSPIRGILLLCLVSFYGSVHFRFLLLQELLIACL